MVWAKTITQQHHDRERRRPDRSKGHEVEQPDRHRLDMPKAERPRQGHGEAWPPPFASDRFEMLLIR